MAKNLKKGLSAILAALMCLGTMSTAVMAVETTDLGTIWYGDEISVDVEAGEGAYIYRAVYGGESAPGHANYETSNHVLKDAGAVSLLPMVIADSDYSWTPNGLYEYGESNYDVMYCCDVQTGYVDGVYYKRVNLEDSNYYDEDEAAHIRAIVTQSYPYVSVDEMKAFLLADDFEYADELDRAEMIAAVQAAIWYFANGETYEYNMTANIAKQNWGGVMHDYTAEMSEDIQKLGTYNRPAIKEVGERINALIEYLKALTPISEEDLSEDQIVISNLEIEKTELAEIDGYYKVHLKAELNREAGDADVSFAVYVDGEETDVENYEVDGNVYTMVVEAKAGETIKAVVSGTQTLEKGVYFYEPEPRDIDGDGIATSREVSQNLVGVGEGETPVHAEAEVVVVVNPVTGAVTLEKVDENGNSLTGAAFDLYTEMAGEEICLGTFDLADGTLFIGNLKPGSYWLVESRAPAGFVGLGDEIKFTVEKDGTIDLEHELVKVKEGEPTEVVEDYAVGEAAPVLVLELVPGEGSDAEVSETDENGFTVNERKAEAYVGEVETAVNTSETGDTDAVAPVYDVIDGVKEDKGGMFDYQFNSGLTSSYSNPDAWTNMPADADVRYVGTGEHSKYYVYVAYVEYEKNDDGSAVVDENGEYKIKELRRYDDVTSPALTIGGEPTTELITEIGLESEYDNPGGSRPFIFALKDREGQPYYGYCCDLDTPANSGFYYTIGNLEDSNYYGSEDAEDHIRSIAMNGYWGTTGIKDENGNYAFGSLELLKEKLKAYLGENPELNVELTAPVLDPNNKYQPVVNEKGEVVTATKDMYEMVEGLTSGEALLATQAAFWTHANGSYGVLNGKDGSIVLDPDGYKWNHDAMTGSKSAGGYTNGEAMDDFASTAVDFLYTWLINLDTEEESTVIINDKNFVENMAIEIGSKAAEGDTDDTDVYNAAISFDFDYEAGEADELSVDLTYVDAYGETVTLTKSITGEGEDRIDIVNKRYVISGLEIAENQEIEFTLNIYGTQYLEQGAYVYLAHGGRENSQNFIGVMEGEKKVDVSKTVAFNFEVTKDCKTYTKVDSTIIVANKPEEIGTKNSELIDRDENRYEITVSVPGQGEEDRDHDEVILMVDGSYSMDNEWPAMKDAINTIGEAVLDGNGNTQLTLMAFGMGDNVVLEQVKSAEDLAAALGELPGTLLYGRSSTNCEAGFTGVAEYIEEHEETLEDAFVIFISDGNLNTDETPRAFDANWQTWTKFGALTVAQEAFGGAVNAGENLPEAFTTVFGDRFDGAAREEILERAFGGEVTDEEFLAFAEQVWTDVYAYSGLTRGIEYPVSDAERAFVKYDKEKGTYIQDLFYYTTYKSAYVTYNDCWTRTPAAADKLAAMSEVAAMYVVDYDGYTAWMDTGITSDKSTFIKSNGITGLVTALEGALVDLSKTPFNNVVVTDYMSKWVNLDASTLQIVDDSTGETIWTAADGWRITDDIPTAQNPPVVVELVDPSEYEAGGDEVIGNENGEIYKLTWYVKDGAMLRSDNYSLKYEVTVDIFEENFEFGKDYPANGNTDLWVDGNHNNEIEVPEVDAIEPKISFESGDASNISFMLIDPATGDVEFLYKTDIENQTSFEIPVEAGKVSAVFVKQSTSGMFWFAEEVDEELVAAAIDCLKNNNPSYKGHNAVAFGGGEHDFEFKPGKVVTYTFTGVAAVDAVYEGEIVIEDNNDEEITDGEENINGNGEDSTDPDDVPEVDELTLNYEVNVDEIDGWMITEGITAIYIAADGKVPAVLWTSAEVDDLSAIIDELGADSDCEVISGEGSHVIEYHQNKNKVNTVTYTFTCIAPAEEESAAETPEVDESVVETPAEEETVVDTPEVVEPTLNYAVDGAEIADWMVTEGITAMYLVGKGKVPAVIWVSEEVDDETAAEIIDTFEADSDITFITGLGEVEFEYQQNKKKTKTVTYTITLAE